MNSKFTTTETAWCPGCGNFSIISCLSGVLNELELSPSQVVLVGGIGQAAKTNQYITTNGFSGLHGRALPAAVGIKLANNHLTVIVNTGDGIPTAKAEIIFCTISAAMRTLPISYMTTKSTASQKDRHPLHRTLVVPSIVEPAA